jgi:glycosyltransferase involved in cell wall biosynthesis
MLETCLRAVRAAVRPEDEVIVADSASVAGAAVARVATDAGATVVRCEVKGASRARNAGWRAASNDLVLFVDDDCQPHPGWAAAYAAAAAASGAAFFWGPVTVEVSGTGTAEQGLDGPAAATRGDDVSMLGPSCNLAVRKQSLEQVGGFDDLLGAGTPLRAAEDRDLQVRLLDAGGDGAFVADALVSHELWRSRWELLRLQHSYGYGSGALALKLEQMGLRPATVFTYGVASVHAKQALVELRGLHELGFAHNLARATGVWRGRRAARRLGVRDGHLLQDH